MSSKNEFIKTKRGDVKMINVVDASSYYHLVY